MDVPPETGLVLAAGWTSQKLFGPIVSAIGQDWADRYSDYRLRNLGRVLKAAEVKLGPALEDEGQVPPRVVNRIMSEASWSDAEVMAEYFGGIVAAARSTDPNDDRGAFWAGLVASLSVHEIYMHYVLYAAIRSTLLGSRINLWDVDARGAVHLHLTQSAVLRAMQLPAGYETRISIFTSAVYALSREELISNFDYGEPEYMNGRYRGVSPDEPTFVFSPSMLGLSLFFQAHGISDAYRMMRFCDPDLELPTLAELDHAHGGYLVEPTSKEEREAHKEGRRGGRATGPFPPTRTPTQASADLFEPPPSSFTPEA